MNRRILIITWAIVLCCLLAACGCEHEWVEANCTSARYCSKCEKTEGEPLGHDWVAASCEKPETCARCGETNGEALGHQWSEASCTEASECTVCGAIQGEALGHTYTDWEILSADFVAGEETVYAFCDVCGEEAEPVVRPMVQLHKAGEFLLTPEEFTQRIQNQLDCISGNGITATGDSSIMNAYECVLEKDVEEVGAFAFYDQDKLDWLILGAKDAFRKVEAEVSGRDNAQRTILALILTCDPSMDFEQAKDAASVLLEEGTYTANGITYTFEILKDNDSAKMSAELLAG